MGSMVKPLTSGVHRKVNVIDRCSGSTQLLKLLVSQQTKHSLDVGTMLVNRLRRWPNIVPTLSERIVFAGVGTPHTQRLG